MRPGFYLLFFIFFEIGVSGAQEQAIGNFSGLGIRAMGMGRHPATQPMGGLDDGLQFVVEELL